jgi:hypothetical protein
MSALIGLLVVALLASLFLVAAGVIRLIGGRFPPDAHGFLWQAIGLWTGLILCLVLWTLGGPRHVLVLALPSVAGCCWLLALLIAERTRHSTQTGDIRIAGLAPRRASRYVVRWAPALMRASFLAAVGLALTAILLASAHDPRAYGALWADGGFRTHGPWPGWPYAIPALVGLAFGWMLAEAAIRVVVNRAPASTNASADDGARMLSARAATTAACIVSLPTLAALLVAMGACFHSAAPSSLLRDAGWAMSALGGLLGLTVIAAWLAALLTGGRAVLARPEA